MNMTVEKELLAHAIGTEIVRYLEEENAVEAAKRGAEHQAAKVLEEIQAILDDESLEDPECFQRIEQIVNTFQKHNLSTTRHDW